MNITHAREAFSRLVLYAKALDTEPGHAMRRFVTALDTRAEVEERYLDLVRVMYMAGPITGPMADAWQNHLLARILADENPLTLGASAGPLTPEVMEAAAHDLRHLQRLFQLTGPACLSLGKLSGLPTWPGWGPPVSNNPAAPSLAAMSADMAAASDWSTLTERLVRFHRKSGAGIAAAHWYMRWTDRELTGITEPQLVNLDDLVGLQEAKATVIRNTEQFLRGGSANNLLLYGTRGTGKSSMVRGLAARYGEAGLRLVEVSHAAINTLPELFRILKRSVQRFVLFLDDLSFDENASDYRAFKSMVEGALEERPANVLLYATSNRRHLLPERWTDRNTPDTAEVHWQDAMEEKLSLADRFGVTVLFPTPSQEEYLVIAEHLAQQRGLRINPAELREAALRWVVWNNPRSGRAARQFVDDLAGRLV